MKKTLYLFKTFTNSFVLALATMGILVSTFTSKAYANYTLKAGYESGFERINSFADGGIAYYILSNSMSRMEVNFSKSFMSKRLYWILNAGMENITYKTAPNMSLLDNAPMKNFFYETGISVKGKKAGVWNFVVGNRESTFITDFNGNVITTESLGTNYFGMKFILDFFSTSSAALRMQGHFKYYMDAQGQTNPDFEVEKGHNFGGKFIMEIGKRSSSGMILRVSAGYEYHEFNVSDENQSKTQLIFGAGLQMNF